MMVLLKWESELRERKQMIAKAIACVSELLLYDGIIEVRV